MILIFGIFLVFSFLLISHVLHQVLELAIIHHLLHKLHMIDISADHLKLGYAILEVLLIFWKQGLQLLEYLD